MHNPAPVLENDSHKLLWDFNIQTDHLIPARRPDLIIINKRKRICKIVDLKRNEKKMPLGLIISKKKLIIFIRITRIGYVMIEMK